MNTEIRFPFFAFIKTIGLSLEIFTLRFSSLEGYFEFKAKGHRLQHDICDGFMRYRAHTGNSSGVLDVFHAVHGWWQVTIGNNFLVIGNPMQVDYDTMHYAIIDTLVILNSKPKAKNLSASKAKNKMHLRVVK